MSRVLHAGRKPARAPPSGAASAPAGVQQLEAHIDELDSSTGESDMAIVTRAAAELVNPASYDLELELATVMEEDDARSAEMAEEALITRCISRGDISSQQLDRLISSASEVSTCRVLQV